MIWSKFNLLFIHQLRVSTTSHDNILCQHCTCNPTTGENKSTQMIFSLLQIFQDTLSLTKKTNMPETTIEYTHTTYTIYLAKSIISFLMFIYFHINTSNMKAQHELNITPAFWLNLYILYQIYELTNILKFNSIFE